jgi:oxygen-independent coproporphyrinogen-3 oxidase
MRSKRCAWCYTEIVKSYSLYLHIPFCHHRCGYCDFNTYAGLESLIPDYVDALCREAELLARSAESRLMVHTLFFGGGTPSLLPAPQVERILQTLGVCFDLKSGLEITLEANPGTVSRDHLYKLRHLGINRLSLGMQSAHPGELSLLEREHGYDDVVNSVAWARQAGFENLNLDLIFGLPHQAMETWQQNLTLALNLSPEHLSMYALTLEHGTPMENWVSRGLLSEPDPDMAADMYEWASNRLAGAGYQQYEISNWARLDSSSTTLACQHNLQYWRNLPYLGLGAGAHGYAEGVRTANVLSPASYIKRFRNGAAAEFPGTPATASLLPVDPDTEMRETMMMGLRLTREGVSRGAFERRFGRSMEEVFGQEIEQLRETRLLEWAGDGGDILRLTDRGRLLGNQVFMQFI